MSNQEGQSKMSLERNKSVTRRFIEEIWNNRQLDVADEIFAPDCITHQLRSGGNLTMPRGPEALKYHVTEWLSAFPDIHIVIEQMLADADLVMTQCVYQGTHSGIWNGVPPSGKVITIQVSVVHRIVKGLIVEDWVLVDSLGLFQQLGVVPPTAELFPQAS
jgi:steroid delta-isomerase-like uncharacterized protein